MAIQMDKDTYPDDEKSQNTTIDDLVAAFFMEDLQRALTTIGCHPHCVEDSGVCASMAQAHDCVTDGPCFEMGDDGLSSSIPSKIEVMYDGDQDTIMSANMHSASHASNTAYESFGRSDKKPGNCNRTAFFRKCLKPVL